MSSSYQFSYEPILFSNKICLIFEPNIIISSHTIFHTKCKWLTLYTCHIKCIMILKSTRPFVVDVKFNKSRFHIWKPAQKSKKAFFARLSFFIFYYRLLAFFFLLLNVNRAFSINIPRKTVLLVFENESLLSHHFTGKVGCTVDDAMAFSVGFISFGLLSPPPRAKAESSLSPRCCHLISKRVARVFRAFFYVFQEIALSSYRESSKCSGLVIQWKQTARIASFFLRPLKCFRDNCPLKCK